MYAFDSDEISGKKPSSVSSRQLDYYQLSNKTTIKKLGNDSATWFVRSYDPNYNNIWYGFGTGGNGISIKTDQYLGVSPAFRIGN